MSKPTIKNAPPREVKVGSVITTLDHARPIVVDRISLGGAIIGRRLTNSGKPEKRDVIAEFGVIKDIQLTFPGMDPGKGEGPR